MFERMATAPVAVVELSASGLPAGIPPLVGLGVIYVGIISTAGAFYLGNKGMALLSSGTAAVLFFAQPVVGALLGSLLEDVTRFFSLPVPRVVWKRVNALQNDDLVQIVESCLKKLAVD